ncbi:MAG: hypothetical protein JSU74_05370, partial [Candidatus Zixiibacteriota bacterium]
MKPALLIAGLGLLVATLAPAAPIDPCVDCHTLITPNIVSDWQLSKHSQNDVPCATCHGEGHMSADDVANVEIPTAGTCETCHETQVTQFSAGKHALSWASMKAMPTTHALPIALNEGMKGCGGCHKMGLKSAEEIQELAAKGSLFGNASCDACHTRHVFSVEEAKQPQACQTCHMGFDHPQWEMYSGSKHGVRYLLKQKGILPEDAAAPTCQTCHMAEGNHEVRTPLKLCSTIQNTMTSCAKYTDFSRRRSISRSSPASTVSASSL